MRLGAISSYWLPKLHAGQHAHAKVRVVHTAFTSSSIALQQIFVNEIRVTAELAIEFGKVTCSRRWAVQGYAVRQAPVGTAIRMQAQLLLICVNYCHQSDGIPNVCLFIINICYCYCELGHMTVYLCRVLELRSVRYLAQLLGQAPMWEFHTYGLRDNTSQQKEGVCHA